MSALAGRHALVTGANRGIGLAIARALCAEGAKVSLLVRDAGSTAEAVRALRGSHAIVVADVTDRTASQAACAAAAAQLGPVDILVNNAGSAESAPFLKSGPDLFERMLSVHLMAAVHTTQAVLPGMLERGSGQVINVASVAGLEGAPYVAAYVAAKHALVGLTRALALEVAAKGIGVNAICPGYTDTDLVQRSVAKIAAKTGRNAEDVLQSILAESGQARIVTPEEVASAVLALCTAGPGAATGQAIRLDGGTAS
jgi:NAD(P)-dependent dehydrogenase (short-subunit alcohol dehydrogenase family)